MSRRSWQLIILVTVLAACNGGNIKKRALSLDDAIDDYNSSLRWSRLNTIENYHLGTDRVKMQMDRAAMEKVRVTGYAVQERLLNEDATEAVIKGEIDYYTTDTGTLKKHTFAHLWWYDEELKRWFNGSDFLDLK